MIYVEFQSDDVPFAGVFKDRGDFFRFRTFQRRFQKHNVREELARELTKEEMQNLRESGIIPKEW